MNKFDLMVQSISEAAIAALYLGKSDSKVAILNTIDYQAVVVDTHKAPEVYVMLRGFGSMIEMLKLAAIFLGSPNGLITKDIDAEAYDLQIAEFVDKGNYPDSFADVEHLFTYDNAKYAVFLSIRLNSCMS